MLSERVGLLAILAVACGAPPIAQPPVVAGPVVDSCNAARFDASSLPPACLLRDAPCAELRPPKDAVSLHAPALTMRSGDLATFPIELENVSDHALTFEVEHRCPDVEIVGHDIRCAQGFCGNGEGAQVSRLTLQPKGVVRKVIEVAATECVPSKPLPAGSYTVRIWLPWSGDPIERTLIVTPS
jgi:hypothetical protein